MTADPVLRIEGALKACGRAVYEAETRPPGLLHAVLVEAPVASGEVLEIDTTDALGLPGVLDIVTSVDAEALAAFGATRLIRERRIHFAGQAIALVVAESAHHARAAALAVKMSIDAHPAVTSLRQALHLAYSPTMAGRVPAETSRGDATAAIAGAHWVVRGHYETATNNHHPMEPHAIVCFWEGDKPTAHTNTQAIFGTRQVIARAFGLLPEDVRVVARYLGGGFGCKGPLWWPWMLWALIAARRARRPVRLELGRAQLSSLVGRRAETIQDLTLGLDADGGLTAIHHDVLAQTSTHDEFCDSAAALSRWLYACPNVTTRHRLVRTNEPHPIPMRAPGVAPGGFALESALDEAAELMRIDPVELRVRNFADHDQQTARPWTSNSLLECYRVGAERFGWAHRPGAGENGDGRWRIGWGMATACYPVHRQPCDVRLQLAADAALLVQCGTQDMGSGTYTALGQMAAELLGVPIGKVTVELGDTWLPEGPYSGGSMVTASFTPAVETAAAEIRARLIALAACDRASPLAGLQPEDLDLAEGRIFSRGGNASEALADLLTRSAPDGLEARGSSVLPEAELRSGMGYGAVFVEVGVDPDLGEIRVRRVTAAYAAGRIVNPLLAESQYVGGLIGGIGMALHERTVTDQASGRVLSDNFTDYLIPTHADIPAFDVTMIPEVDLHLPGGVKGIGMLGSAGVQAAIANAVSHAVGKRIRHLPIRIEDILA